MDTPTPPYVAVIFTSRKPSDDDGYRKMAARMSQLVRDQPGFLGMESVRDEEGFGVTVSYWRDETAVLTSRSNPEHQEAQRQGKRHWHHGYRIRVCEVKRDYAFEVIRDND